MAQKNAKLPAKTVTSKKVSRGGSTRKKIVKPLRSDMRAGDYKTR